MPRRKPPDSLKLGEVIEIALRVGPKLAEGKRLARVETVVASYACSLLLWFAEHEPAQLQEASNQLYAEMKKMWEERTLQ